MGNPGKPGKSAAARLIETLASVKFAVTVVVVIAVACIAGTLLPQGADVAAYLRRYPAAGARMELFGSLGLTHVFYSWWFIGLLCVLASTIAVCSSRRFNTVRRTTGYARGRAFGSMLTHISMLLILAGGVVRGVWGQKGYIELREGDTKAQFVVENGEKPLPFALHLSKFEIETDAPQDKASAAAAGGNQLLIAWPDRNLKASLPIKVDVEQQFAEFRIKVLRYVPDFVIDMGTKEVTSRSNEPRNPAILVAVDGPAYRNHRWLFAKFPDFVMHTPDGQPTGPCPLEMVYEDHAAAQPRVIDSPIKNFKSTLDVVEGDDAVVQGRTVEVNSPFTYKGYTFYQAGYNPDDLSYTSLEVVKDPGVTIVYAGFSLLIVGLFVVFYLNPWLNGRKETL
jgi:cytochrome c biogenesis protein ResB